MRDSQCLLRFRLGKPIPLSETGAYCIARDKLDENAMHRVLCQTGDLPGLNRST